MPFSKTVTFLKKHALFQNGHAQRLWYGYGIAHFARMATLGCDLTKWHAVLFLSVNRTSLIEDNVFDR